jgi:hypothetical protein
LTASGTSSPQAGYAVFISGHSPLLCPPLMLPEWWSHLFLLQEFCELLLGKFAASGTNRPGSIWFAGPAGVPLLCLRQPTGSHQHVVVEGGKSDLSNRPSQRHLRVSHGQLASSMSSQARHQNQASLPRRGTVRSTGTKGTGPTEPKGRTGYLRGGFSRKCTLGFLHIIMWVLTMACVELICSTQS